LDLDVDIIVERYRSARFSRRLAIIVALAILPPIYMYLERGDALTAELEQARQSEETVRFQLADARKKRDELPKLRDRHGQIEQVLERTKKYLPDKVQIEEVLAQAAGFEKDLAVQIQKFGPSDASAGGPAPVISADLNYHEVPLSIEVKSEFPKVIAFFDRLVHLDKILHLRNAEFTAETMPVNESGIAIVKAQLILFESNTHQ